MTFQLPRCKKKWRVARERGWKLVVTLFLVFLEPLMPRSFKLICVHKLSHYLAVVFNVPIKAQAMWQSLEKIAGPLAFVIGKSLEKAVWLWPYAWFESLLFQLPVLFCFV